MSCSGCGEETVKAIDGAVNKNYSLFIATGVTKVLNTLFNELIEKVATRIEDYARTLPTYKEEDVALKCAVFVREMKLKGSK